MRLKELRKREKITQEELAKKINIPKITYQNYEREIRKIPTEILEKLANYYNVTIDYIIGREFTGGKKISESEYELLSVYRELNEFEQKRLLEYGKFLTTLKENLKNTETIGE